MVSVAELKIDDIFLNTQVTTPLRQTIEEISQLCSTGILNDNVKQRRPQTINMHFY